VNRKEAAVKLCKVCLLPQGFPHISFDKEGVCDLCRAYKGKAEALVLRAEYKKRFERLVRDVAGKGAYDILMCYSGGKDSTYTLDILRRKYRLNVLAFTFDNGFIPERTYINIRNVVEKLGVDHIFFKPDFNIVKRLFAHTLKSCPYPAKTLERASAVCTTCMGMVKYSALKTAIEKAIPLIAFGWSPGQAPITSSIIQLNTEMVSAMERALKAPMEKIAGGAVDRFFLEKSHYKSAAALPPLVHPLALLEYNEKKILAHIKGLGWRLPKDVEMNATNCLLNPLADESHISAYGFHPYTLEIAAFVREGYMSRAEGIRHLPFRKDRKLINSLKKRLGV
jgi:tRNA(Ile)-lysidine synthase TilS/MesJ